MPIQGVPFGVTDGRYVNNILMPGAYLREYDDRWQIRGAAGADRYTLQSPNRLTIDLGGTIYVIIVQTDIDLSAAASWDTLVPNDYTVAANRAGHDFYVYGCIAPGTNIMDVVLSDNPAVPVGYLASNSRRLGGFHCLCVNAGAIAGHPLTGFLAGDLLPASIWDYIHRPQCEPEGMVYDEKSSIWVDIYLASGVGAATASVYNAVITDTRDWMDFVGDGSAVGKRMLFDFEFQCIAAGSNEQTNILGSADPVTTGGHSDTTGRRMISYIGVEDTCGAIYQFLLDQSYRYDGGAHLHTTTITRKAIATGSPVYKDQAETNFNAVTGSGANETVNTSSVDPVPTWSLLGLPGAKGAIYKQGTYGDVKLVAGGYWLSAGASGSRGRMLDRYRWAVATYIGSRFASERR